MTLSRVNVALSDQILTVLAAQPGPVATLEVCALLGFPGYTNHATVLRMLNRLAALGLAYKLKDPSMRSVYWLLAEQPEGMAPERHQRPHERGIPR